MKRSEGAGQRQAGQRSYECLAGLPLNVDQGYDAVRQELAVSSGFVRATTTVVLRGGGHEGRGEDVSYASAEHDGYPLALDLASGIMTLADFSRRLGELDLFPGREPQRPAFRKYRRWAFESAALDLALQQGRRSLGAALGRDYRPLRFIVSTRQDVEPWLAIDPELEFKLDPTPDWSAERFACLAAADRVRILDLKSFYEGSPVDNPPDADLYRRAAAALPAAILEDPALSGPARDALNGAEERFSFDAPIDSWAAVEALPLRPRYLNIKPSRFGSLEALFDCVDRALAAGITLYGGGQFELSVGRPQIQAVASLFYADGPNDVAPADFHTAPHAGVPRSPLRPCALQPPGFGFVYPR